MSPLPILAIGRISQQLIAAVSLEETLVVIAREGALALDAPLAALMLWDEAAGNHQVRAVHGFALSFATAANRLLLDERSQPFFLSVLQAGSYHCADTETHGDREPWRELSRTFEFRSVLAVPITFADRTLGILAIYWRSPYRPAPEELALLETLAELAAAAIYHARLIELVFVNIRQTEAIIEQVPAGVAFFADNLALLRTNLAAKRYLTAWLNLPSDTPAKDHDLFTEVPLLSGMIGAARAAIAENKTQRFLGIPDPQQAGHHVDLIFVPIPFGNTDSGLLLFILDASDRVQSTERLELAIHERTRELRHANDAKRSALERLASINALSSAVTASLDVSVICRAFAIHVKHLLPADRVSIAIAEEQPHMLMFRTIVDHPSLGTANGERFPLWGQALIAWAMQHGPILYNLPADQEPEPLFRALTQEGMQSCLYVPLHVEDKVLGVAMLASREFGAYAAEDLADFLVAARQLAAALANARAHAESLRLSRLKDEFIAIASHELRTPMTAIKGFAVMLEENDLSLEERLAATRVINTQTDRLVRILDDLLDITCIASGRLPVNCTLFTLEEAIKGILHMINRHYPDRLIQCQVQDMPLQTDRDRFEQILINLLDNACKYASPTASIRVTGCRHGNEAEIRVYNDGQTLTPEEQRNLFEKFGRLERNSHEVRGTGLGLFITRRLVELLGGRIWVENATPSGVAFIVRLPELKRHDNL
ncbi:MAG: GAF domain-containing protein [Cyanobacteria bacterium NC_groundwater_1444_Ag_S-0.65um_54_12]|nr:GAF domain-containing protein [Cyanobacteria bacterium NC_groundwater_1444_Ag_S-0.65um_54_12]